MLQHLEAFHLPYAEPNRTWEIKKEKFQGWTDNVTLMWCKEGMKPVMAKFGKPYSMKNVKKSSYEYVASQN